MKCCQRTGWYINLCFCLTTLVVSLLPVTAGRVLALEITEVMYSPAGSDSGREWVELHNNTAVPHDLTGSSWFDGRYHPLGQLTIPAGGYAVLADNAVKFRADYPAFNGLLVDTVVQIINSGEVIRIESALKQELVSVLVLPLLGGNGDGYSLEWLNGWRSSMTLGGSPGVGSVLPPLPSVKLTELTPSGDELIDLEAIEPNDEPLFIHDGGRNRKSLGKLKRGRQKKTRSETGIRLNDDGEMIRITDSRGRELHATPIFVTRHPSERLQWTSSQQFRMLKP